MALRDVKVQPDPDKGGPPSKQRDLDRPSAREIYDQVARNARRELDRPARALAVSGLVGGLTMGLTALSVAVARSQLGNTRWSEFVAQLFYPVGFLVVILGRGQLFTENTLYPVALILAERRHWLRTLRLWATVYPTNIGGAMLFAFLVSRTSALRPASLHQLIQMGVTAAAPDFLHVFWSAVIGGWLIAMVAWLVSGSHSITGSVAIIWVLAFIVGLGHFAHCVATSGEILAAVLAHSLPWKSYSSWLLPATLGNIAGGVGLVTLLEYGQAKLE